MERAGADEEPDHQDRGAHPAGTLYLHGLPGSALVIAGPNGAGKSTLMQVLDGKRRPPADMVRLGTGARPSIFAQQQNRLGQGRVIDVIWSKSTPA